MKSWLKLLLRGNGYTFFKEFVIDQLNIWVVLYTCGFAMGIFMTLLFVSFHKKYPGYTLNIAITLFILSLLLFSEIAEESNIVDHFPILMGIGSVLDLLLWPFLLFYVQFIVGRRIGYQWQDLLYFVPFLIALWWQMRLLSLPKELQLSYFSQGIPVEIAILVGFKLLISFAFLAHILFLLGRAIRHKSELPKSRQLQFLLRIRKLFQGVLGLIALIYLLFFNQYFQVFPIGDSDRFSSLMISGMLYFFALLIFKNPDLLEERQYSSQVIQSLKGREADYSRELMELLEVKKVYLNEKLTLKLLADKLDVSSQQLSYLVNNQLGVTFLDLINSYRVKEVQEKIQSKDYQNRTLLGLALESGFNSKASFNRIFKDHTGVSPSLFLKKIRVSNKK